MATGSVRSASGTPAIGEELHGFRLDATEPLAEIRGDAWTFTHVPTGARLLWLANDDEERAFSITFKTPPADDTGVFHILEHSVLDGSERYPVKEPFVELVKTSMATFLNALTFPDKTMYPVASTNVEDLEHLMDVYLDAVFHPRLHEREDIFRQEGWHLELESPEAPLALNGVVLNEMKGALSDPDDVLFLSVERALFPDTCYRWESGGDPRAIPELTYEAYRDAHRRHYRPDNAHVVLYGDLDLGRELAFLDERLRGAPEPPAAGPNPLSLQAPTGVVERHETMAMAPEHAAVALGFVFATSAERERVLAADILLDAIAGSNEAPLKRAVLESGLGDDLDCYLVDATAQPFVLLELKGARPWAMEPFRATVHQVCTRLAHEGIGRERLEAALSQAEFVMREGDFGYPDGVHLAMASLASWLYDEGDPLSYLRYEEAFRHLREGVGEGLFEALLLDVINSPHACLVGLAPGEGEGDDEAERLRALKATLSPAELDALCEETERLHAEQARPDDPAALATLPRLSVSEIGEAPAQPASARVAADVPVVAHAIETHGIDYVSYYFGLRGLPAEELPYLSVLASLLGKLDTASHTAAELDTLVEAELGDLSFFCEAAARHDDAGSAVASLVCSAAALSKAKASLAELPREVWLETRFDDKERIRSLLVQRRIGMEQGFIGAGHSVALARVDAQHSVASAIAQRLGGIDFYRFLTRLIDGFDERFDELRDHLGRLRAEVFVTGDLEASFAGEEPEAFWALDPLGATPRTEARPPALLVEPSGSRAEAWSVPAGVGFVAEGAPLALAGQSYDGAWMVLGRALSYSYLWNEVRVLGGAYGAGLRVSEPGLADFYSFRDPAVDPTLRRFADAPAWLSGDPLTASDVEGYVVSCVGALDRPLKPRALMRREDLARLTGRPEGWRERVRAEVLAVTPDALRDLAGPLETCLAQSGICVVGQAELLRASSLDAEVQTLVADGTGGGKDARTDEVRR